VAQEENHCEWLLRYGIYDTQESYFDRYSIGHLKTLLQASKAETYEQFEKEAGGLGIGIPGIVSVDFGGHSAKRSFKEWKAALLAATDFGAQEHETLRVVVHKISPTLMATVQKCLDNPPRKMLVGWVHPSKDDLTFRLTLKYNPADDTACEITSVSFKSSMRGVIEPLKGDEANLLRKGQKVPIAGLSVSFQRQKPTEEITVVVNTSKGPKELDIPGVNPDETINLWSKKIAELERKIGAIQRIEADTWAPREKEKEKFLKLQSGWPRQTFESDAIDFPEGRFAKPPIVLVSVTVLQASTGNGSWLVYEVQPSGITKDGFKLRISRGDGTSITGMQVQWIAIEQNQLETTGKGPSMPLLNLDNLSGPRQYPADPSTDGQNSAPSGLSWAPAGVGILGGMVAGLLAALFVVRRPGGREAK
jgi:hypothetical protein